MITFQGENIFLSLWINNYLGAKLLTKHTWLNVLLSKFSCSGDKESTLEGTCTLLVLLSKWIKSYYCTSFRTDNAVSRINYLIGPSTFRISRNQKTIIPHTIISSSTNSKIKTETDQCKLEIVCKAKLVESEVMPVKTWFELVSQGRKRLISCIKWLTSLGLLLSRQYLDILEKEKEGTSVYIIHFVSFFSK